MMLPKNKSFDLLEPPILSATLLAISLGGVAAWTTTGVFSVGLFLIVAALGVAAQVGLHRLRSYLPWSTLSLLVIAVYWTQAGQLDWIAIWPTLIVAVVWAHRWPVVARFASYGYVAAYGLLLTGVVVAGIPVWCLLCLLPAPLAWRAYTSADAALAEEWALVTGMFLVVGYLIEGLIR
jgi:hypothetical protein